MLRADICSLQVFTGYRYQNWQVRRYILHCAARHVSSRSEIWPRCRLCCKAAHTQIAYLCTSLVNTGVQKSRATEVCNMSHFLHVFLSTPGFSKWTLTFTFSHQNPVCVSLPLLHVCVMGADLITVMIFVEECK
jgi:hypothetical protein